MHLLRLLRIVGRCYGDSTRCYLLLQRIAEVYKGSSDMSSRVLLPKAAKSVTRPWMMLYAYNTARTLSRTADRRQDEHSAC